MREVEKNKYYFGNNIYYDEKELNKAVKQFNNDFNKLSKDKKKEMVDNVVKTLSWQEITVLKTIKIMEKGGV